MSSKIYEEALAEAKQLKEIAEQNAKNAIVEAVTPKIREFIDNQLMGESESNVDEGISEIISESLGFDSSSEDNDIILDESAMESLASLLGSSGSNKEILNMLAESVNELKPAQADLVLSAAKKLDSTNNNFELDEINKDVSDLQENTTMPSNEKIYEVDLSLLKEELSRSQISEIGDNEPEEVDSDETQNEDDSLKEMLRDLGLLNEDKIEIDLGDDVELPEDVQIVARLLQDEEDDLDADLDIEDEVMDVEEDELVDDDIDITLDETFEIDANVLKAELMRMKRLVREAKTKSLADAKGGANPMEGSWGGKGNAKAGLKNAYGGKGAGKGNAFGGGTEKGDVYKVKLNALAESLRKEMRKNRTLETRLDEYRGAVETLREQLTDLNLFNAKLLYVNKLFQDKSVTPTRRRAMMESIDSAKSLREVKLIYKTLTGSPARSSKRLNESTKKTLGSSSRSVGRSSATSSNSEVDRWAILAGIKN